MRWRAEEATFAASTPVTLGPTRIKAIDEINPTARPVTAPAVLNRFQNIDMRITGKFAEAATAKASATRKATLAFGPRTIAIAMATIPTTKALMRATITSSPGWRSTPRWITLVQKSCANEVDALMVSPATTAKIVAKA